MYYVFNKKDSLISATPVAWVNVSAHEFSMWSKFKSKDTLISTHAITLYSKSGKTKGDTSVIEMAFNKNGKSSEKTIYEKKELKLGE